jgi:Haem-degrading
VVDPAGNLLAFERMDGVRPASADLAIGKARTAARLQRPTAEIEDNINQGRTAFVTANIAALRGGTPIRLAGEVVGAVGIAGLSVSSLMAIYAPPEGGTLHGQVNRQILLRPFKAALGKGGSRPQCSTHHQEPDGVHRHDEKSSAEEGEDAMRHSVICGGGQLTTAA